jgi:AAA domain, putative AbiEii toxin, Type IV TA system
MLKRLHLENVGPASQMDVEFADRLNVFTGDNGLGKTFLLDIAWWLLVHGDNSPSPKPGSIDTPQIAYETEIYRQLQDSNSYGHHQLHFDRREQRWFGSSFAPQPDSFLSIYAKVDSSISIYDSLRLRPSQSFSQPLFRGFDFTPEQLWNGLIQGDIVSCNGLIQDWVRWQNHPDQKMFSLFWKVLKKMFSDEKIINPGETVRLSVQDVRDIPTIELVYGQVAVVRLSAAMKRVLGLAYSVVWAWSEHQQAAKLMNFPTSKILWLIIDEIESHLHPQWQRSIFPAILEAIKLLDPDLKVQVLTTTHSPLVLASLEPYFDEETDKLFGFDLVDREVVLEEMPWVKLGEVDDWLTSPIFGLKWPRSKDAEVAIEAAFTFMRKADMSGFPANLQTQDDIHQELRRLLPDDDEFWERWVLTGRVPIAQHQG